MQGSQLKKPSPPCPKCNKVFSDIYKLASHQQIHEPDRQRTFECLITGCGKKFFTKNQLRTHTRNTHSTIKNHSCNLCDGKFKTKTGLNCHIVGVHCQEKAYQCDKCPKRFSYASNFSRHALTHSDGKHFSCSICLEKFKLRNSLKRHIKVQHEKKEYFNCSHCHKDYRHKNSLRQHVKKSHDTGNGTTFECYFCTQQFFNFFIFERHITTHTDEKPFFCSIPSCRYSSSFEGALKYHKIRHHSSAGQPPSRQHWSCYFCSKRLSRFSSLIVHLRIHTLETPFPCNLCSRSFKMQDELKAHISTHTKEKPFKCPECDKSFTTNIYRLGHIASTHRKEKRFFCDVCSFSSYHKTCLSSHRLIRHNVSKNLTHSN